MAALRRHAFVEKVLKRLFPSAPDGQEKRAPVTPTSAKPAKRVATEEVRGSSAPTLTGGDSKVPPGRRLYTASLPPEGYVPAPLEPPASPASEDSSGSADAGGECHLSGQDLHGQPKRRRTRKRKSKKNLKNPNNIHGEQEELEKQQSLLQEKLQPQRTDGPTISKNKRRKLKKKQQIKRKKAAGLLTKPSGVSFLYQPEQSGSAQDSEHESDGEDGADARGEDGADARGEDGADARGEDGADARGEDCADARGEDSEDARGEDGADARGEDCEDARGEDCEDARGEDCADARGEDGADTRGENSEDARGEDCADAHGEDGADARGEDSEDARGEDSEDARGEDSADAPGEDGADARGEDGSEENRKDNREEDVRSTNEKAAGILNFLKSTQEIYFYDGVSKDAGSAVPLQTTQELFKHLDRHGLSPSDVLLLDHMKRLLLLQDTERLKQALETFPERCTLPPDHTRVLLAFFNYWIKHILPEKQ